MTYRRVFFKLYNKCIYTFPFRDPWPLIFIQAALCDLWVAFPWTAWFTVLPAVLTARARLMTVLHDEEESGLSYIAILSFTQLFWLGQRQCGLTLKVRAQGIAARILSSSHRPTGVHAFIMLHILCQGLTFYYSTSTSWAWARSLRGGLDTTINGGPISVGVYRSWRVKKGLSPNNPFSWSHYFPVLISQQWTGFSWKPLA